MNTLNIQSSFRLEAGLDLFATIVAKQLANTALWVITSYGLILIREVSRT